MNDLLDFVLDAHGGLKRWSGVSTLTVKLAVGGPFWDSKWPGGRGATRNRPSPAGDPTTRPSSAACGQSQKS